MVEKASIDTDLKGKSEEKGTVVYREHEAAQRAIEDLNGMFFQNLECVININIIKELNWNKELLLLSL